MTDEPEWDDKTEREVRQFIAEQEAQERSLDECIGKIYPSLYRYAYKLVHNAADAEEMVQEAFFAAAGALRHMQQPAQIKAVLIRILRNEMSRKRRHRRKQLHYISLPDMNQLQGRSVEETDDQPLFNYDPVCGVFFAEWEFRRHEYYRELYSGNTTRARMIEHACWDLGQQASNEQIADWIRRHYSVEITAQGVSITRGRMKKRNKC